MGTGKYALGSTIMFLLLLPATAYGETPSTIYTSVPNSVILPIIKQIDQLNPDINFRGYRSGTNKIIVKVKSDLKSTGRVKANLIWAADPAYFIDLKEQGLLLKYTSPNASVIPSIYKDPDGFFTVGRILNMGITYNTKMVSPDQSPKDWMNLLDNKWKGQIAIPAPNYSWSTLDTVEALSSKFGWDFFKKLWNNGLTVMKTSGGTVRKVSTGDVKSPYKEPFQTPWKHRWHGARNRCKYSMQVCGWT